MTNGLNFVLSKEIIEKLSDKHNVSTVEVEECFYNRCGDLCVDDRDKHRTDPPTQWFVSETDKGRKLKVIFVLNDSGICIKSAYDANEKIQQLYVKQNRG